MDERLQGYRKVLAQSPQLVLTKFGTEDLRKLYQAQKLAYEMWRYGAALRITGKGAPLVVDPTLDVCFYDDRGEVLDTLVARFDERAGRFEASATGTVFESVATETHGAVLLPVYNVGRHAGVGLKKALAKFRLRIPADFEPNFLWLPFNLGAYIKAHQPYATAFKEKNGVRLDEVFAVLYALLLRLAALWSDRPEGVAHYWQRAYEGPALRQNVINEIQRWIPAVTEYAGINVDNAEVASAFEYLELTAKKRNEISVLLWGPHSVFLPFGQDRVFIDFAWVLRFLFNLFFGVQLADQNFKGDALEYLVRRGRSVLPTKACKAEDGSARQVDGAWKLGTTLVIAECRAVARSFGIETGDSRAIAYRIDACERALRDAEDTARWLAAHPVGTNHDILSYKNILPIGVTPFVEFIPKLDPSWWLTDRLPRVMTPEELTTALDDDTLKNAARSSPAVVRIPR
jgi:hypothetical protein